MKKSKGLDKKEEEVIMTIGGESEKASIGPVREELRNIEKLQKKKDETSLNKLDSLKSQFKSYKTHLMTELHDGIARLGIPPEFEWGVWFDGKGIRVAIITPLTKTKHERAFKITNDPMYDFNAVREFIVWVEDIIDLSANKKPSNGLWIPKT